MKKYLKSFKQNAAYSGSAIESGDHFKNGASPKSLTSRGNLLFGVKTVFILMTAAFICVNSMSFGQFYDMSQLNQWLNQQNQQTQQMMNDYMNEAMKMLMETEKAAENSRKDYENSVLERLKSLTVDASKSYYFKNKETDKYGAVVVFNADVGLNTNGLNPTRVKYYDKNEDNSVDITNKCIYMYDRILVPPVFTLTYGQSDIRVYWDGTLSFISKGYIKNGSFNISATSSDEDDAIRRYDDYYLLYKAYYNTMIQNNNQNGMSISPFSGSSGSSSAKSSTYEEICSRCKGKGWVVGSKTPTYGNTGDRWCSDCNEYVIPSHSHDRCTSCMGRGKITRIK
ncbi:MAG: hypothetical protein LBL13_01900 [Bacteroidales bacterium]|jgi:hypothetical protein|nr:hypothetical protein [Bacteroidales bacterium]